MNSPRSCTKRTQEEAVADQMDCDLENFVRRALCQAVRSKDPAHWRKVSHALDGIRALVRQKMHEQDRAVTA